MTNPPSGRYVRARMRVPQKETAPAAYETYNKTEEGIADRLRNWSEERHRIEKGQAKSGDTEPVHPIDDQRAKWIARELLAAVHRAKHSVPVTAEVWQTYVTLYGAMQRVQAALAAVAGLPFQYQHLQDELVAMKRAVDELMLPAEPTAGEAAIFRAGGKRYVFQKRQRGRSKVVRAEIVRQAIAVWLHRFQSVPPAYPNSVFDEVLRLACEYHGMDESSWPGLVVIRAELAHFERSDSPDTTRQPHLLRFYPGKASE